jgi:hypothetical protein
MRNRCHKEAFEGILLTAFLMTPVLEARAENTTAAFLRLPPPRAYALGRTETAMSFGAQAVGANPANLGRTKERYEVNTGFSTLMDGEQFASLAFASAFKPGQHMVDAVGFSVLRLGTPGMDKRDDTGAKIGEFSASDTAGAVSVAKQVAPRLQAGVTLRAVRSQVDTFTSNTSISGDAGLSYTGRKAAVSLCVNRLGQGVKLRKETSPLPSSASLGIRGRLGSMTAAAEGSYRMAEKKTDIGLGMEYGLGPVSLRAGYRAEGNGTNLALKSQSNATKLMNGFTAGMGLKLGSVGFDYAVAQSAAEWGLTHMAALTFAWGGRP